MKQRPAHNYVKNVNKNKMGEAPLSFILRSKDLFQGTIYSNNYFLTCYVCFKPKLLKLKTF